MKKAYWWILGLIIVGFVLTGLFLSVAPDQIPMHYGASGQIDRWGSKNEMLLLPVINLLFGGFMVWLARREGKQGREMNERVVAGMTALVLAFFNLLWLFFMWKAVDQTTVENGLDGLSMKACGILIFALMIPLGNSLPKAQRNSIFGLRTKWSMASDRCWQQSQRLGGYSMMIAGILGVVLCALLPSEWSIPVVLTLVITAVAISTVGSYRIYRREQTQA